MEFKGTPGPWAVGRLTNKANMTIDCPEDNWSTMCKVYVCSGYEKISRANALLISKAPELLEALIKSRQKLASLRRSISAHPDCEPGSEFDDCVASAQELEDEIELLIESATMINQPG